MRKLKIHTNESLKALESFMASGKLSYLDLNPESTFSLWKQHSRYEALVQGTMNSYGQLDGLAARITPGKQLQIGYYKKDKKHGECITIFPSGTVWTAVYVEGQLFKLVKKSERY